MITYSLVIKLSEVLDFMAFNTLKRLGWSATRGVAATALGSAALEIHADPEVIRETGERLPELGHWATSPLVELAAQYPNATIAATGLMAISLAVNRGPIMHLPRLSLGKSAVPGNKKVHSPGTPGLTPTGPKAQATNS